ncbi:RNA methyltransferase [Aureimonas endophytica]|uniref:RNA methyltransferase n=1 Tax=Aureimonas endophytica TaxID=2027858 RepID=A0A917E1X2_9HYPH|nr:RNA methyltransferase [Aureimonas endophytica]GGD94201.1 RNA methyltransferase [Aureimonas endophytica]
MAELLRISDPNDPRVAVFRDIRERDLVRDGGFIAEGTVVVDGLVRSRFFRPERLLVLENRVAGLADLLAALPPDVPVLVAGRNVIDAVAGFPMHRGVLAHGVARVARPGAEDLATRLAGLAETGGIVVVAVGIANHDNIGAIFRNAAAFGAGLAILDETSCDPLYRKALRVSAGAVLHLPFLRAEPLAALAALTQAGFSAFALSPSGDPDLAALDRAGPAALFLGTEGEGLPLELMAAMRRLRIDMVPGFDSLNVATSAAIALQRLYSARRTGTSA